MIPVSAYAAQSADAPLGAVCHSTSPAGPDRRPHRDPVLRRLPLRPAHRAQRVAGIHRLSGGARARDCRPRRVGRQRRQEVQGGRPGRRGLPRGLVPRLPELRRESGAVLREGDGADLQQPRRAHPRRDDLRRLLHADRRRRAFRPARAGLARSGRRRRRCCAPASRRTRRCGTGTSAPARRSGSSASAGWATWA